MTYVNVFIRVATGQILGDFCKKDNNDMEILGDFIWNLQNFPTDFQLLQCYKEFPL